MNPQGPNESPSEGPSPLPPQGPPQQTYGQQSPYGQAPPPYGQPTPQQYGQPPQQYGQPQQPYGQQAPPYGAQYPGQWPPNPYQQQPGYGPVGYAEPINAGLILGLGIASIFILGLVLGPTAWVMANNALRSIDSGRADPSQRSTVIGGRICGILGTIFASLWIAFCLIMFAIGVASGPTHVPGNH